MARSIASWLSGPARRRCGPDWPEEEPGNQTGPAESDRPSGYPGQTLGLPEHGSRSLVRTGRRLAALLVDWLLAYGLAALAMTLGLVSLGLLSTAVLVIWLILGAVAVRLFEFTPGQFVLGLRVVSIDGRMRIGSGRAALRGVLIALVIPALFVDVDGRGLQDRVTGTAVVRR
jgi:RDD family